MDRHTRKELAELRCSPPLTLTNMRAAALDYYPADKGLLLLEALYQGWLTEHLDRLSLEQQQAMHRFCKWMGILLQADHLLLEKDEKEKKMI